MKLNRNPENYFAEIKQAAFAPLNLVPGIGFSPDKRNDDYSQPRALFNLFDEEQKARLFSNIAAIARRGFTQSHRNQLGFTLTI